MKLNVKRALSLILSLLLLCAFALPAMGEEGTAKAPGQSPTGKGLQGPSSPVPESASPVTPAPKGTGVPVQSPKAGTGAPSSPLPTVGPSLAAPDEEASPLPKAAPIPGLDAGASITPEPAYGLIPPLVQVEDYSAYHFTAGGAWVLGMITTSKTQPEQGQMRIRVIYPKGQKQDEGIVGFNLYEANQSLGRLEPEKGQEEPLQYFEGEMKSFWASSPTPTDAAEGSKKAAAQNPAKMTLVPLIMKDGKEVEVKDEEIAFQKGALAMVKSPEKDKEDRLILRKAPGSTGEVLGNYYGGVYVTLTHQVDETWAKVRVGMGVGAATGYMNKNFLLVGQEVLKADLFKPQFDQKLGIWKKFANAAVKEVVEKELKLLTQPREGAATLKLFTGIKQAEIMGIFYDWYPSLIEGKYGFIHTSAIYKEEPPKPTAQVIPPGATGKAAASAKPKATPQPTPEVFSGKATVNHRADIGYRAVAKMMPDEKKDVYTLETTLTYSPNFITNAPIKKYEVYVNGIKTGDLNYAFEGEEKLPTYFKGEMTITQPIEAVYLVPILNPGSITDSSNIIHLFPKTQSKKGDNG